jgi:hypothetical protein
MKLKTAAVIAFVELIVLGITVSAQARIGWTLEECIQHYGPDTPVDGADKNGNAVTWHTFNVRMQMVETLFCYAARIAMTICAKW